MVDRHPDRSEDIYQRLAFLLGTGAPLVGVNTEFVKK